MRFRQASLPFAIAVLGRCFSVFTLGFAPAPFGVSPPSGPTALLMSEETAEEAAIEEVAASAPARTPSGMPFSAFRKSLKSLSAETFSQTLSEIEPFLLSDAGSSMYAKSMRRIGTQARLLGVEVPAGYAQDAAATEKRRSKQDAFIKVKEEERMAAEAEAAEAASEASTDEAQVSNEEVGTEETFEEPAPGLVAA